MKELQNTTRDIARELARKYSTMTHEELDMLESILVPKRYSKGEMILKEGEVCENIYYIDKGLVRQFYFKNNKELTEHIGSDGEIFMCIESLFKEEPTDCKLRHWSLLPYISFQSTGLSKWHYTTSTSRFCTGRYWKRASSFPRFTQTC